MTGGRRPGVARGSAGLLGLAVLVFLLLAAVVAGCDSSRPESSPGSAGTAAGGQPTAGQAGGGQTGASVSDASYGRGLLGNGRALQPAGRLTAVGNAPTGGAATPDGRFFWSVSTGRGRQDIRIVANTGEGAPRVVQTIPVPGASGGLAFDPVRPLAYLSGIKDSSHADQRRPDLPGRQGDVVSVYRYDTVTGQARFDHLIAVPPPPTAPAIQSFPPSADRRSWPDRLAISPDGRRLLVPLNLADAAAVVDTATGAVRNVPVGHYPYGAAVLRDGRTGLVSNEAQGTVSVIDLAAARVTKTITVGPNLSHPEAVVADPHGDRAFVAVANSDQVVVLDTANRTVRATVSVERPQGLGTSPVALSLAPDGRRLYVAEEGADDLAVIDVPTAADADTGGASNAPAAGPGAYRLLGRIPTAASPTAVAALDAPCAGGGRCPTLVYQSAKGLGVGPNPNGPRPTDPRDSDDRIGGYSYLPSIITGQVGLLPPPADSALQATTATADRQLIPVSAAAAPTGTPLHPGGPIQHVFYLVRENRTYDQVLGDVTRGDGDPKLALFGPSVTPNLHALTARFPLLDHVFADSEASIDGHFWTSAGQVSDYVQQNWPQNYGARGRPYDFGVYSVTWPGNRFLFDQARKQHISSFNYGEAVAGALPIADKDRDVHGTAATVETFAESDLGAGIPSLGGATPGGQCYPNDAAINKSPLTGHQTWDSTPPAGAASGAESRFDCFRARFQRQLTSGSVPALSYLVVPNDHTAGVTAGQRTPQALVADNDYGTGQIVDLISHSPIWASSLIVVVEDDSQDGADHVDAHRIPAMVISPYAKAAAMVHTRYDQLSVIRTMELVLGLQPLGFADANAAPMYDAFTAEPQNNAPYQALLPSQSRTATSTAGSPGAAVSRTLDLTHTDAVRQRDLDRVLWQSVHGNASEPPPPGPGAVAED